MSPRRKDLARRRRHEQMKRFVDRAISKSESGQADSTGALPADVKLFEYEIIDEPMEDPRQQALSPADRERVQRLAERAHEKPAEVLEEARRMREEFPDLPMVHNYACIAAQAAGMEEEADRLIEETYRRFPDYVFGVCNYVNLRLAQNRLADAQAALEGRRALHQLAGRQTFHLSEAVAYFAMMALLADAEGQHEHAERHLAALRELAPDHPMVERVANHLALSTVTRAMEKLKEMAEWRARRAPRKGTTRKGASGG